MDIRYFAHGIKTIMAARKEERKLRQPKYTHLPKPEKPRLELHLTHVTVIMPR